MLVLRRKWRKLDREREYHFGNLQNVLPDDDMTLLSGRFCRDVGDESSVNQLLL